MMEWYIRELKPRDRDSFLDFLGRRITSVSVSNHYQWLYRENPHGQALTWLAINCSTEKIIGCTSLFPRKVWVRGSVTLGCVGGDTFIDPMFRRKGIATELLRASREGMAKNGLKFHYGFPNADNFVPHLKAGSIHPGDFQEIRLLLRIEPAFRKLKLEQKIPVCLSKFGNKFLSFYIKSRLPRSMDENINIVSKFDNRFDKLIETVIPSFNICGIRDSNYLNWRYCKNPLNDYTILSYCDRDIFHGFAVLQLIGNRYYMFDFFVKTDDKLVESFISALVKFVLSKGCELITWGINPRGPYVKNFLRCGFNLQNNHAYGTFHVLLPNAGNNLEYLTDLKNWYLTFGDYDIESLAA
jgi:GNAT superfamily N-acetyltransferase